MKITYNELANGNFQQLWGRIIQTPTNQRASYWLGKLHQKLETARKGMASTFMSTVAEEFGEKESTKEGEPTRFKAPQEPVDGYFFENSIMVKESRRAEYVAAMTKLGQTEVDLEMEPLPMDYLSEVKIAPVEQALLMTLFCEYQSPTVRQLQAVTDKPTA
jgi:hypothetical protein